MYSERRNHLRHEIMTQIRVKRGHVTYIMDVRDVSLSGMFVATDSFERMPGFRVNQSLELDIFTTDHLDNVRVNGHIVRIVNTGNEEYMGFGVNFDDLTEHSRMRLEQLIERAGPGLLSYDPICPPPLPYQKRIYPPPLPKKH